MRWFCLRISWLLPLVLAATLFALDETRPPIRIGQLACGAGRYARNYPGALMCLLEHAAKAANINLVPEPVEIVDFADERIFQCPFIYANYADRQDWHFSEQEKRALTRYLENGGFLYIDAGIIAAFLREHPELGQHHSFGDWEAAPPLQEAFAEIFPQKSFQPLKRSDRLFSVFYAGLPDATLLPDTVRDYTINEKWPGGSYSAVALYVNGRIAVLCTPIIAMGWGKNSLGQWNNSINFRVLESTEGLDELLKEAAYNGARFEVTREDGDKDIIFCQDFKPAWAMEPGGRWRVFRYYGSQEISDFAHEFYTRLGTNILVFALTQ